MGGRLVIGVDLGVERDPAVLLHLLSQLFYLLFLCEGRAVKMVDSSVARIQSRVALPLPPTTASRRGQAILNQTVLRMLLFDHHGWSHLSNDLIDLSI